MEQDAGMYFCTVSNDAGSVDTDMVELRLCKEGERGERERERETDR